MKTIAISANTAWYVYNFRKSTIEALIKKGYHVVVITALDQKYSKLLETLGCQVYGIPLRRRSINPLAELKVMFYLYQILREKKINVLLNFTPKNNIYGSIVAPKKISVINNISGLGDAFVRKGAKRIFFLWLYQLSQQKAKHIFFQNRDDLELFLRHKVVSTGKASLIAGSGVDLNRFSYSPSELDYPRRFILVGRLLEEKGVRIYADAARILKDKYKEKVDFNLLGFIDNENVRAISYPEINSWINDGVVNYLGSTDNVETIVKKMDCVVLPSFYREGIPKSLIEAAALGKIIVTTDNVGCRDTVKDKLSGFLCKPKSVESLVNALEKVILIDKVNAVEMGKESRKLAVEKFDENLIIAEYIKKIES